MATKIQSQNAPAVKRKSAKRSQAGRVANRKKTARTKKSGNSEHTFERIVPALPLRTFLEGLTAIGDAVPPEIRATIPTDFSQNLDHYLYGTPKDEQ